MRLIGLLLGILLVVGPILAEETQGPRPEESPGLFERIKRQAKIFLSAFTQATTTTTQRTLNIQLVGGGLNTLTGTGAGANYYLIDYGNGVARRVRARNGRRRFVIGGNGRRARRGRRGRVVRVG